MRWAILALLWTIAALTALQSPIHAQTSDANLPVSLERIRAALDKPPPLLSVPSRAVEVPTFRVEVRQPLWVMRPIEEERFDPTLGLPSVGELLMGGIEKIHSAAVAYKRRRAERRARREVDEALSAFCAVHGCPVPDTGR